MLQDEGIKKDYPGLFAEYKVKNIRTVNFNKETGAYLCKATINSFNKERGFNSDSEVSYLVELSDNGKEFYVTLEIN